MTEPSQPDTLAHSIRVAIAAGDLDAAMQMQEVAATDPEPTKRLRKLRQEARRRQRRLGGLP